MARRFGAVAAIAAAVGLLAGCQHSQSTDEGTVIQSRYVSVNSVLVPQLQIRLDGDAATEWITVDTYTKQHCGPWAHYPECWEGYTGQAQ